MPTRLPFTFSYAVALTFVIGACGGRGARSSHDAPIPPGEPRTELRIIVDLVSRPGCDEVFDLALYEHRGVDLVTWEAMQDSGLPEGSCRARHAVVRYVPGRISEQELLETMRRLSRSLEVRK